MATWRREDLERMADRPGAGRLRRGILALVLGRVSTEVDTRLRFDTRGTVKRTRRILALYDAERLPRTRVLIKVASTSEGKEADAQKSASGHYAPLERFPARRARPDYDALQTELW